MGLVPQKQHLGSTALSEYFLHFTASLEKCELHWRNLYLTLNYEQNYYTRKNIFTRKSAFWVLLYSRENPRLLAYQTKN